ncbi:MAG: hypothetical protein JHC31_09025, partial [Sulfurihydrogenibium sp.]|nr:hypothetical protein [Sulfurihydrogenibium sp.]
MDYRIGKIGKMIKMLKDLCEGKEGCIETLGFVILLVFGVFVLLKIVLLLKDSPDLSQFAPFFAFVFGIFFTIFPNIYADRVKSRRKIRKLKSAILLELRYILVSLIENFTRFYEVYFATLRFFKF